MRDLAALAAQPRRRKTYSEVRDQEEEEEEEEEEGNDGEAGEEVLGYWSNPEAEVGLPVCVTH